MGRIDITLTRPSPGDGPPEPRTPREQKLQRLFPVWVAMGSQKNLGVLAQREGVSVRELIAHAKRFDWQGRVGRITRTADEKIVDEALVEAVANVNAEHIDLLRQARARAFEFLKGCTFDKPADAIKLLLETIRLEREVRGLDQKGKEGELGDVLKELVQGLELIPAGKTEFEFNPNFQIEQLPDSDEPPAVPAPEAEGEGTPSED